MTANWRAAPRYLAQLIGVAAAYFVLAKFGLRLASINPSTSPIWPATGLALAAVLLCGYRIWPAIFIGALAANITTAGTLDSAALIALGNTLEGVTGGWLSTVWSGTRNPFATPLGVLKFAAVSAGGATVLGASIGVATLIGYGLASQEDAAAIWMTWWLGDLAGAVVVAPVVVLWGSRVFARERQAWADVVVAIFGAVAVGIVAFSPLIEPATYRGALAFLAIVPLTYAALRVNSRITATVSLILSGFAVWGMIVGANAATAATLNEAFLLLIMFMISTAVPSLALSADAAVRRQTESELRAAQADLDEKVRERTAALAQANVHLRQRTGELADVNARLLERTQALGDANVQLTEAQRLANMGSWVWDVVTNKVTWSDQLLEMYGLSRGGFGGTVEGFLNCVHPDDRETVKKNIGDALASGSAFSGNERIVRPDGEIRQLQSLGEVVRGEDGVALRIIGICLDVTERKQVEDALRESEQSYRLLVKGVQDYAIYGLDTSGRVRNWNAGAERIKGYNADEIVGQHFSRFYTEEGRANDEPAKALAAAARDGEYHANGWRVRKDGTRFFASIVLDALRDDSGELIGFAKVTRDITKQREAEEELAQTREQLAQAQKMEAIGQLTGGIAHDFNNLLMIISGHAQLLQRRLGEPKDLQATDAIRAAANRGEKLTRQLLAFSRRQKLMPVSLDLRKRIDAVREMIGASLRGNIELAVEVDEEIWPVEVDLGELELALVNVTVNARDAMPQGGRITLAARNVVLKPGSAAGPIDGDFVALAVIDTGTGIAPELLDRVFEPFFTTKPIGKGTGLGLSQVHGFAHQSGGAVTVSSEVGQGTVVTIYLPRSAATAAEQADGDGKPPQAGHGTILMVEDSREVAEVTGTLLEQLGFRVVRAENAAEALRHLKQEIGFDLLFSDIVMPGPINGFALAQECAAQFPDVPILLTSGYSDAAQAAESHFPILRKPYDLVSLDRAIQTALKSKSARPQGLRAS